MAIYKLTVKNTQDHSILAIGSSAKKTKSEALNLIDKKAEKIADFLNDLDIEIGWFDKVWKFVDTVGNVKAIASWELDSEANYQKNVKTHQERLSARKAYERHGMA